MKICSKCKVEKELSEFGSDNREKDGVPLRLKKEKQNANH